MSLTDLLKTKTAKTIAIAISTATFGLYGCDGLPSGTPPPAGDDFPPTIEGTAKYCIEGEDDFTYHIKLNVDVNVSDDYGISEIGIALGEDDEGIYVVEPNALTASYGLTKDKAWLDSDDLKVYAIDNSGQRTELQLQRVECEELN